MGFGQTGLRTTHCQSPQGYAVKKTKIVQIEVQNGLLSRSPQRLDQNLCQHARHLLKLH